jgi:hypothetical protein
MALAQVPSCDVRAGSGLLHLNSSPIVKLRTKVVSLAWLYMLLVVAPATATQYFDLGMHGRVQVSDVVVLARVVDPASALVNVERVLKGEAPKQITLEAYVDGFAIPAQRKPLIANARELLFLRKKDDAYAPVQDQYGRLAVDGDRLIDSFRAEPRSLSQTVASIQRLVSLQARAARGDADADAAYVTALKASDIELKMWALGRPKTESRCPLPRWPTRSWRPGQRLRKWVLCSVRGMQRVWWPTP